MAKPVTKPPRIGVVLTGHPRQRMFYHLTLPSLVGYKYGEVVVAYDAQEFGDTGRSPSVIPDCGERWTPDVNIVYTGFPPGQLGHAVGELHCMKAGVDFLMRPGHEHDYIYKSAADTTLWRHEGLVEMAAELERWSMITFFHHVVTVAMFARGEDFKKVMDHGSVRPFASSAEGWIKGSWKENGMGSAAYPHEPGGMHRTVGRIHVQGQYALNHGRNVAWTWKLPEHQNDG